MIIEAGGLKSTGLRAVDVARMLLQPTRCSNEQCPLESRAWESKAIPGRAIVTAAESSDEVEAIGVRESSRVEDFRSDVDMEDLANDEVSGGGAGGERDVVEEPAFEACRSEEDSRGSDCGGRCSFEGSEFEF